MIEIFYAVGCFVLIALAAFGAVFAFALAALTFLDLKDSIQTYRDK